jgi:hypothetical protein
MLYRVWIVAVVLNLGWFGPVWSEPGPLTFGTLLSDGRIVTTRDIVLRLASVKVVESEKLNQEAKALIKNHLKAGDFSVGVDFVGTIMLADGQSLQSLLIRHGLARVYPQTGEGDDDLASLLIAEALARTERKGLWALNDYQVIDALEAPDRRFDLRNYYQLIEGQVIDTAKIKGNIYINFGTDWRTDFTAYIPKRFARNVQRQGLDYKALRKQRVRVRGWMKLYGGPMIEVTDFRQIEFLQQE